MHERVLAEPKITATGVVKTGIFLTLYTAGVVHLAAFPAMWTHEAYAAIKEKITGRKMPSFEERCIDKGPFYWRREWWQDYDHKAVEEKRQREQAENRRLDDELKRDSRHEYQRALNIVVIQAQKMTGAQTRKEKYAVMREAIAELHGHLEQHHSTSLMSRRSWRL